MTERTQLSLFARTTLMIVGGVVMTFLVFFLIHGVSSWVIDTFYMRPASVERRNQVLAEDLQSYVTENALSSLDFAEIDAWVMDGAEVDLVIYEENGIYEAGRWGYEFVTEESADTSDLTQWGYSLAEVAFANGTRSVAIADCSDLRMRDIMNVIAVIFAFGAFVATLLGYARRISRSLNAFSAEVTAVVADESAHVEEMRGLAELNGLAQNVNRMHDAITERTRSAQDALQANRELITALSHDIRNPLTSLIGYLDLLGMESDAFTDTQKQYLTASMEKADRLRTLTDEMFRYFLIFSDEKPPLHLEAFDAQILLEQMLGEYAIELESLGYTVCSDALQTPCSILADTKMLHRVLENLFSNIRKYADPDQPIRLAAHVEKKRLLVSVENAVRMPPNNVESNRVGLKTCAAILELLNGTFSAGETNGQFVVTFTLPLAEDTETES